MSKVIINVETKDSVKEALGKSINLLECQLDVPTVDPTRLNAFDKDNNKIFQVSVKPVVNQLKEMSDGTLVPYTGVSGLMQVGVVSKVVKAIALVEVGGEDYARINGTIDLPIRGKQKRITLEEAWFTDLDVANAVCMACAEIEYEKVCKMEEEVLGAKKLLRDTLGFFEKELSTDEPVPSRRFGKSKENTANEVANILEKAAEKIRDDENE